MSVLGETRVLPETLERTYERVGSSESRRVDVRVVATTNRDLRAEVSSGRFRQDLFFRVAVLPIAVPPLRQRIEDVPLLIEHFAAAAAERLGRQPCELASDALDLLCHYHWPGNVRELENVIEKAAVMTRQDMITPDLLPPMGTSPDTPLKPLTEAKEEFEKTYLKNVLQLTGGNISRAAQFA